MYIYGGSILSLATLVYGFLTVGSFDAAVGVVFDFYISKLAPWPLDEALLAKTWTEFIFSHLMTIGVGQVAASSNWLQSQM